MICKEFLIKGLGLMGLELPGRAIGQLCEYYSELLKWNRKINLVARAGEEHLLENHFLDSLTLLPLLDKKKGVNLLDVGSGAGFPGLAVKIACPELHVVLAEPRQKKVSFLLHVIRKLKLDGITVFPDRLERGNEMREKLGSFSIVTSRAFTDIDDFLELAASICETNGNVICMKGPGAEDEIKAWQSMAGASPFILTQQYECRLPFSNASRVLIVFKKDQP